ncbi:hypothetical protein [Anaerotignum propionicum]|uniref:hypothetical protein n=1 Tax=Anaerotignum propionicum TaxID=28446 RepID=UPI000824B7AA|nr:hypothetical protein [Anaerotignum propionicum]
MYGVTVGGNGSNQYKEQLPQNAEVANSKKSQEDIAKQMKMSVDELEQKGETEKIWYPPFKAYLYGILFLSA